MPEHAPSEEVKKLAGDFLSPYFDMLDALGPAKMNRAVHTEKLAQLLSDALRKERLKQLIETQRVLGTGIENFKRWLDIRIAAEKGETAK